MFGKTGANAGIQLIEQLDTMSTSLDEVKKKTGELGKLQEEQMKSEVELQNVVSAMFDQTGGSFERMNAQVKIFATQMLTAAIKQLINFTNQMIDTYNKSEAFRLLINSVVNHFNSAFYAMGKQLKSFNDMLKGMGDTIHGVFTLDIAEIGKGIGEATEAFMNMGVKRMAKDYIQTFTSSLSSAGEKIDPIEIPAEIVIDESGSSGNGGGNGGNGGNGGDSGSAADKIKKIAKEKVKTEEEIAEEKRKMMLASLNDEKHMIELRLDAVEKGTLDEIKIKQELLLKTQEIDLFNAKSEEERTLIMAKYQKKRLDLQDSYTKKYLEKVADTKAKELQVEADGINMILKAAADGTFDLTDAEIQALKDRLTKIAEEATGIVKKSVTEIQNMAVSLLNGGGVNLSSVGGTAKQILDMIDGFKKAFGKDGTTADKISSIAQGFNFATAAVNDYMTAVVATKEAEAEAANTRVEKARESLQTELEARNAGYAANVEEAQKELQLARDTQKKALADQRKAQREQQAIQTIQQIGNLVSASALIWSQLGFPAAVPAIAVMWASFAASQVKANQLAKAQDAKSEQYGDGTVELLEGGSHASGNDIDLGRKKDGTRRRAEGGEFFAIINKRSSRKYGSLIPDVINSLNEGTFADKYAGAYDGGINLSVQSAPDISRLSDDVHDIRQQNQRRMYVDAQGNVIMNYKNLTRRTIV